MPIPGSISELRRRIERRGGSVRFSRLRSDPGVFVRAELPFPVDCVFDVVRSCDLTPAETHERIWNAVERIDSIQTDTDLADCSLYLDERIGDLRTFGHVRVSIDLAGPADEFETLILAYTPKDPSIPPRRAWALHNPEDPGGAWSRLWRYAFELNNQVRDALIRGQLTRDGMRVKGSRHQRSGALNLRSLG